MKNIAFLLICLSFIMQSCDERSIMRKRALSMFADFDLDAVNANITQMDVINQSEVINIPKITNDDLEINYHQLFDTAFIVQLETSDSCLIGSISKMSLFNDTVYVLDKKQSLFMFAPNGKFIREIGNRGQGPGEYAEPMDYFVDDNIYILDNIQKKISVYNKNGVWISDKIVPFMSFQIGKLNSNTFVFRAFNNYNLHIPKLDNYCLWTTDTNFCIQKIGIKYMYDANSFTFDDNGMRFDNDCISVYEKFSDSLYLITNNANLKCRYVLQFNDNRYLNEIKNSDDAHRIFNTQTDYLQIMNCIFNENYVLMQLVKGHNIFKWLFYSSYTKQTVLFDAISFPKVCSFAPILRSSCLYNGYLVTCEDADFISKCTNISQYVGGDFNNIKEDDNPILFFYKLKK
ncbi:MAG: 6-bladed beta-propeller [Bacteroidales bacterium]|nr:6-bladed beta-propeller [Bacteroidales bacterium]